MPNTSPQSESRAAALERDSAWLHRLARVLTRDAESASDAAQTTLLKAWQSAPSGEPARRAWLARVLSNSVREGRRRAGLRRMKEHQAARSNQSPDSQATVDRLELQRQVVEAIEALPEPYRTTLTLRFLDDLSPRAVAARQGVATKTVYSRIERGLVQLREQLDLRFGGDRSDWMSALLALPLADWNWTLLIRRMVEMGVRGKIASGAAAALVVCIGLWTLRDQAHETRVEPLLAMESVPDELPDLALPSTLSVVPGLGNEDSSAREAVAATNEAQVPAPADTQLAEVRGRFLLPDGTPVAGVSVSMHGWRGSVEHVLEHGMPEDWQDPASVQSDASGRFRIELDPPRAFQFTLEGKLVGRGVESWRWHELEPGRVLDLGDTTLKLSSDVLVQLVDGQGDALPTKGWVVYADSAFVSGMSGRQRARSISTSSEADGRFRLVGLPVGQFTLKAYSKVTNWIKGPSLELGAGETLETELIYSGPDTSRRITVTTFTRPFFGTNANFESMRILRDGASIAEAVKIGGSSQSYAFDNLEAGFYTVEIDDRRFQPWSQSGVEPGSAISAHLIGSAAVLLSVSDAVTDESIHAYSLISRLHTPKGVWISPQLLASESEPAAGGLFEGMIPVPQTLLVSRAGYVTLELELPDLAPGETRAVQAKLASALSVRGQFTSGLGGEPIPHARVLLLPLGSTAANIPLPHGWSVPGSTREELPHIETQSNADGFFELTSVPAGSYTLLGVANLHSAATLEPVIVEPGSELNLALVVKSTAGLRGRVRAPAGTRCAGLVLRLVSEAPRLKGLFSRAGLFVPLSSDGSFSITSLPAGLMHASLGELAEVDNSAGMQRSAGVGPEFTPLWIALQDVELVEGQTLEIEFDLSGTWPERAEVIVRNGQQPSGRITVDLKAQGESVVLASAVTGENGIAYLEHVPLGSYVIHLHSREDGWIWESDSVLQVTSDQPARQEVSYQLVSGTLMLRSSRDGTPLADQNFVIAVPDWHRALPYRTDSQGRIKLTLPVGEYVVAAALSTPDELAFMGGPSAGKINGSQRLEWRAGGPIPAEIRFELP